MSSVTSHANDHYPPTGPPGCGEARLGGVSTDGVGPSSRDYWIPQEDSGRAETKSIWRRLETDMDDPAAGSQQRDEDAQAAMAPLPQEQWAHMRPCLPLPRSGGTK